MQIKRPALMVVAGLLACHAPAAQWYVDQNHPAASDSNPGTEALPFKTIQRGLEAAGASDTVWIKAGFYEEALTLSKAGSVVSPPVLSAWSNDSVRVGFQPRAAPAAALWQRLPDSLSWYVQLSEAQPTNLLVLLNGRAIVTRLSDAPPEDTDVPAAAYRAADRTLMINAGGFNPAAAYRVQLARDFTALQCAATARAWIIRKLEFAWCTTGIALDGTWLQVEDCYFHDTFRHAIRLQGLRHMIHRCNFRDCGYAIGGDDAGPAHIIEECLILRCGQEWQQDFLLRAQGPRRTLGPVEFQGQTPGLLFRYNILADNWGAGLSCAGGAASAVIGNAFWDNDRREGLRTERSDDLLALGNYFRRNDAQATVCSRIELAENFFEYGGVVCQQSDRRPMRDSYLVVRQNGFVAPPAGYLRNMGSWQGVPVYSNGWRKNLVDWNRLRIPAGTPWLVDGTQNVSSLAAIQSSYGWDVHAEGAPYNPMTNDLTPEAMRASSVSFRVPWGPRRWQARTVLGDGQLNGWPAAAEIYSVSAPPSFFWHVADGNADNWVLQDSYQRYWPHQRRWIQLNSHVRIPTNVCVWYVDAENVYPQVPIIPAWDTNSAETRAELSSGNRWMVIAGRSTNGFPAQGIGYWSPWLATAPGAGVRVALKLRGVNLTPYGNNTPVVRVDFLNATGQDRQRRFLVGWDDTGVLRRAALTSGSYDWTAIEETITAPTGAVRMALFMGLLPCTGELDLDDVTILTDSAAPPDLVLHLPFEELGSHTATLNVYDGASNVVSVAQSQGDSGGLTNQTPTTVAWAWDLPVPEGTNSAPALVLRDTADRFRLTATGEAITVAGWVYLHGYDTNPAAMQGLVNNGRVKAGAGWSFGLWDTANVTTQHATGAQLYFEIGHTTTALRLSATNLLVPVQRWTHVACAWTVGTTDLVFYINGTNLAASGDDLTGWTAGITTNDIIVGLHDTESLAANAVLDDLRFYQRRLTAEEIRDLAAASGADLELNAVSEPPDPYVTSNVTFAITVTNRGPHDASGIGVRIRLAPTLTYYSHTGGEYATNSGLWNIPLLAAGSNAVLWLTATVTTGGVWTNEAEIETADQPDPDSIPGNGDPYEDDQVSMVITGVFGPCNLAVVTPYGTAVPAAGVHTFPPGTTQSCAIVDSPVPAGIGTHYACQGWVGTGSAPPSGSGTNTGPFVLWLHSTITWLWVTNHYLALTSGPSAGGTLDLPAGWYQLGSTQIVTALPADDHYFSHWSGDLTGCTINGNQLAVPVDGPRAIIANFALKNPPHPIPYAESFESYLEGFRLAGTNGWHAANTNTLVIQATNYPWTGLQPLETGHTNVAVFTDDFTNALAAPSNVVLWTDFMLYAIHVLVPPLLDPSIQLAAYVYTNGHLVILHRNPETGSNTWTELWHPPLADQTWFRLSIKTDYATVDNVYSCRYAQVLVNGLLLTNAVAYTRNDGTGEHGGSWFALATPTAADTITAVGGLHVGALDDYVVTTNSPVLHWLTAQAGPGGWIAPSGTMAVAHDGSVEFAIGAEPHYRVADVLVDGHSIGPTNACRFSTIWADHAIEALFALDHHTLEIISAHGDPEPPVGIHTNEHGSILTNRVTSPDTQGTTQYVCTGWTMTGNEPLSGTGTVMTLTLTNNAVLSWNWKTQYWFQVQTNGNGSVDIPCGWLDQGSNVTITATAGRLYRFQAWAGDTNGCLINGPQITVPGDYPRQITANFVPVSRGTSIHLF